jgi:hypothetical protein
MTFIVIGFNPKPNTITKGNLECDVRSKTLTLITEVLFFEALSDLCSYTIVGFDEVGQIFGNL